MRKRHNLVHSKNMYAFTKLGLLLLTVVCVHCVPLTEESTCPLPADIIPCSCRNEDEGMSVRCQGRSSTIEGLQSVLRGLSGKKDIHLSLFGYKLHQVPSKIFRGLDIKRILISGGEIDEFVSEDGCPAFDGLENSLEELIIQKAISERGITNFNLNLSHLRRLHTLGVIGNVHGVYTSQKKMSLGNDWFENGPSSLQTVRFFTNTLDNIGDRVFSKLSNLHQIDLHQNEIEEVKRSMFPEIATHLVSIDLANNKLYELPEDLFHNMPSLQKVNLMGNQIGTLDQSTWESVWERLDSLKFGSLVCDSSIDWVYDKKRPEDLHGFCSIHSDADKQNQRLDQLIDQKQGHRLDS